MFRPNPLGTFSIPSWHRLSLLSGRENSTSGLAQYQVNSNFTSEQLILRDSFPCRQLKPNTCLKIEKTNNLFVVVVVLIHENIPVYLWKRWQKVLLQAENPHQASPATECFAARGQLWGILVSSFCS